MGAEAGRDGPIRVAVVGATRAPGAPWTADALVRDVAAWDPDRVVLTGGYVARGTAREWRSFAEHWGELADRVVAVPDPAARRGDRTLRRWQRVGAESGAPRRTWMAGTLESHDVRWRFVVLDTEASGSAWLDQRTWVPKVTAGADFDQLLVLTGAPLASLQRPSPAGGRAVAQLLDAALPAAGGSRLLAVVSGGTATNEVLLHSGSFGEVHLVAGNGSVPAADLDRSGHSPIPEVGDLALVDGFDAALQRAWAERRGGEPPEAYPGADLPVRGWWQLELDGRDIGVAFRMEQPDGTHAEVYRIRYTRRLGWVAGP